MKSRTFILSDESINTYGFRLLTSGGDLSQFRKNPVMYLNHDDWSMPIGRWENIRVEDGKILADPVFDMKDEKAAEVAGKVDRGFLRMASIGVVPIERSEEPDVMLPGQKHPTITKWRLREGSIVGIGSNHNAIRLYDERDNLLSDDDIIRLFDKPKTENFENKMERTFKLLSLADNTSDEQLHDAVKQLIDARDQAEADKKELADKLQKIEDAEKKAQKDESVELTDKAIKEGYYNADMREVILKLFDQDFEATKKMISNLPKREKLKDFVDEVDKSELAKLSDMSWDQLDKAGKLEVVKSKYPEVYQEKFDEAFPK